MQIREPLTIKPGERYSYIGQAFQVMEIRDGRVQLRSVSRSGRIIYPQLERLSRAYLHGNFVRIQEAPFAPDPTKFVAGLSDKHHAAWRRRVFYAEALIKKFGGHLPVAETKAFVQQVCSSIGDASPPCYTVLYEWVRCYKNHGGMTHQLIPAVHRKIGHRLDNQPQEIKAIFLDHVSDKFLKEVPLTKAQVIDNIRGEIDHKNSSRDAAHQLTAPSIATWYRIFAELDFYTVERSQKGTQIAKGHQKWSKKYNRYIRMLEIVEGDSHEVDIEVVDSEGRALGRPWLTVLIDRRTRCVVGWDISLNPPSIDKTVRALKQSLLTDTLYGGLAQYYVFDNGSEFIGEWLRNIMSDFGSTVVFCKIRDADGKPHVESVFKTWTKDIAQHLPGTTYSSPAERGDYDSEGEARLTVLNIKAVFQDWLDTYYHKHFHCGIGMSPEEAWEECLGDEIALKKYSEDDLDRYFLCMDCATPDDKGRVTLNNVSWTSGAVPFLRRQEPIADRLCVRYDRSDLGRAWVYHPAYPEHPHPLDPVDDYQIGMTMALHNLIQKKLTSKKKDIRYFQARQERARILNEWRDSKNKKNRKQSARASEHYKRATPAQPHAPIRSAPANLPSPPSVASTGENRPYTIIEVPDDID